MIVLYSLTLDGSTFFILGAKGRGRVGGGSLQGGRG